MSMPLAMIEVRDHARLASTGQEAQHDLFELAVRASGP